MTQNQTPAKTTDAPDTQEDKTQPVPQEVPAPNTTKPAQQDAPEVAGKEPATDAPTGSANVAGSSGNTKT